MSDTPAINTSAALRKLGFSLRQPPFAFLSYDPAGDGIDHHALVLFFREEWERGERHDVGFEMQMVHRMQMAHRMRSDMEYPEIIAALHKAARVLSGMVGAGRIHDYLFIVETNGVGHGYYHALRDKIGNRVWGLYTIAGDKEKPVTEGKITMPRMAGLDWLRYLIESHTVKIAKDSKTGTMAPGTQELRSEINSFVWRGPKRPEALEGQHDDLVMAAATNCWVATKLVPPIVRAHAMTKPPNGGRRRAA